MEWSVVVTWGETFNYFQDFLPPDEKMRITMRVLPLSGCYSRVPTNSPWKMKILTERSKQQTINFFFSSHQSRPSSSHCNSPDTETAAALPADPAVLQWDCTCSVLHRPAVSRHRDRGGSREATSQSLLKLSWLDWVAFILWRPPSVLSSYYWNCSHHCRS